MYINRGTSTTKIFTTVEFDQVIAKMTEFHECMDSLHFIKCEVCQENFQVNAQRCNNNNVSLL